MHTSTICDTCDYKYVPAKSKRVEVCPNCLCYERTGEYLVDQKKRKAKESLAASQARAKAKMALKPQKRVTVAKLSLKGAQQAREVAKTKREVTEAALDGGFCACEGCGGFFDTIDRSHKVPLSQSSEFASDPNNLRLLCRGCHNKFEHGTVPELITLKCLVEDLRYLLDVNPERFWKINFRLIDEYNIRPTPQLGRVLREVERFE